jgi:hypothetical protein
MYPNLYYAVKDLFGIEINGFKLINSFGFFVAIAFITSSIVLSAELKRKEKEGLLIHEEEKIIVGAPASIQELLSNFLLGFIFGYKIIGAFVVPAALYDPQTFILSTNGSAPVGILTGIFFLILKWYEKNKDKRKENCICECGCNITKGSLKEHQKSKKHLNLMAILN